MAGFDSQIYQRQIGEQRERVMYSFFLQKVQNLEWWKERERA